MFIQFRHFISSKCERIIPITVLTFAVALIFFEAAVAAAAAAELAAASCFSVYSRVRFGSTLVTPVTTAVTMAVTMATTFSG